MQNYIGAGSAAQDAKGFGQLSDEAIRSQVTACLKMEGSSQAYADVVLRSK